MGQILYVGILSSGVAYTLQIMAQKDSDPAVISLLLSLESVFAAISRRRDFGGPPQRPGVFRLCGNAGGGGAGPAPGKEKGGGVTAKDHFRQRSRRASLFFCAERGCPLEKRWGGVVYFILYYYGTGAIREYGIIC